MAHGTSDQVAANWATRMSSAGPRVTQGVDATTTAPQQKAIAASSKWQQNVSSPQALERYRAGLGRSTLQDWQNAMKTKGITNMQNGARASQGKMAAYLSQALPFMDSLQARIKAMPSTTIDDRIARSEAWQRGMAAFKRS